jgi:hypothetical protein
MGAKRTAESAESRVAALELTSRKAAGDRTARLVFDQPLATPVSYALARCVSNNGQITGNCAKLSH